jgi:hypothetical protein
MRRTCFYDWKPSSTAPGPPPSPPGPVIAGIAPGTVEAGSPDFILTVNGSGFVPGATVYINGVPLGTNFLGPNQLTTVVPSEMVEDPGNISVVVMQPGGASLPVALEVSPVVPAGPVILQLDPMSTVAGSPDTVVLVTGTGFTPITIIAVDGLPMATTYISPTELSVIIPAVNLAAPVTLTVVAINTMGTSNPVPFMVTAPLVPVINAVNPDTVISGAGAFDLTLTGTNFTPDSIVSLGGSNLIVTYVSSTELIAAVPPGVIPVSSGSVPLTVTNSQGTSNTIFVSVVDEIPVMGSVSPSSIEQGSPDTLVTITGTGFVPGATVNFNGTPVATTYVSPVQVTATIPASSLSLPGTADISVTTPSGTSLPLPLIISPSAVIPVITLVVPDTAYEGSPDTEIVVTGSGFEPGAVVNFNGNPIFTLYNSPTQVIAIIPEAELALAVPANISVTTSAGTSTDVPFTISPAPVPVIIALTPVQVVVGSNNTPIILTGTGFFPASTVTANGVAVPTTYISPNRLLAIIPAGYLSTVGSVDIGVSSPGGISATVPLQVLAAIFLPTISSIAPETAHGGDPDTVLVVTGNGFEVGATVNFDGSPLATTFDSATQLSAIIPAALLASPRMTTVSVTTSAGTSLVVPFDVLLPIPNITSLNPSSVSVGDPDTVLTVTGSGFGSAPVILVDGNFLPTTMNSPTELVATIPASYMAVPGALSIEVISSGGLSPPVSLPVLITTLPTITGILPSSALAGSADTSITITGTNFVPGAQVEFDGTPVSTVYNSSTEVTAVIPSSLLGSAGSYPVTVTNSGGTSGPMSFTIVASPVPVITNLNPASAPAGSPDINIIVTGSGFIPGAQVQFDGAGVTSVFNSATQVTGTLPGSAMLSPMTYNVNVTTSGGSSNLLPFTVTP